MTSCVKSNNVSMTSRVNLGNSRYLLLMSGAAEPEWLSEEELEAWRAVAMLLFRLPAVLDRQLLRDSQLTLFEYFTLSGLSMMPGRTMRMSELALWSNSSLSRLSNVVKRLEQRGWIERHPDPDDGRYTAATLTDAGWDIVVAAAPGHVDAVRQHVISPLTAAQVRTMGAIGTRISASLDTEAPCGE